MVLQPDYPSVILQSDLPEKKAIARLVKPGIFGREKPTRLHDRPISRGLAGTVRRFQKNPNSASRPEADLLKKWPWPDFAKRTG